MASSDAHIWDDLPVIGHFRCTYLGWFVSYWPLAKHIFGMVCQLLATCEAHIWDGFGLLIASWWLRIIGCTWKERFLYLGIGLFLKILSEKSFLTENRTTVLTIRYIFRKLFDFSFIYFKRFHPEYVLNGWHIFGMVRNGWHIFGMVLAHIRDGNSTYLGWF